MPPACQWSHCMSGEIANTSKGLVLDWCFLVGIQELRLIELRCFFFPVPPPLCDIKTFCTAFGCVQGRQSRLHLSQRDATDKSECKTLISSDPDEGVHYRVSKLLIGWLVWRKARSISDIRCSPAPAAAYMCALCRFAYERAYANEGKNPGNQAANVAGIHTIQILHPRRKCLWFPVERTSSLQGHFSEIADQLLTLM